MYATDSLFDFYEEMGKKVLNPHLEDNLFNYPFGSWLFIAVLAKVTNLEPDITAYLFSALFLGIVAIIYFIFAGLFLETKSQKLFAVLFLFSMPSVVLTVNNFRPSTFVLPFLLFVIYISYSEEITLKNLFLMLMTVFVIALTHTGSLIYLMIFSIGFFWMYCLFGRKFSRPLFILSSSTFLFFWIAVKFFPHLYQQYAAKATLFLTPGNFLSNKFHIFFADELSNVIYNNLFINHEFVYVIICSAFIFAVGSLLVFLGNEFTRHYSRFTNEKKFALIPSTGMSHSFLTTPFWIGPIHVILGIIGFFQLDLKGKCLAVTVVLTTVAPAIIQASEGISGTTGALREISYLYIIVPVVAVLGLWYIVQVLKTKLKDSKLAITILFAFIFSVIIITPVIGNGYYLPSISGDDYIIEGMQWLSDTGDPNEKVAGYGYRTVPVYTEKMDVSYGLASGTQTRTFIELLNGIYFSKNGNQMVDLYSLFGTRYVLMSDKLINNLNKEDNEVVIDSQKTLDKIFSSRDFGIYAFFKQSKSPDDGNYIDEQVSINTVGSNIEIRSKSYKVILDQQTPTIKSIGDISRNYLQEGVMYEMARISWLGNSDDLESYTFFDETFTREIVENQIIYHTVLKDERRINDWSSVSVIYTFLPEMIKREFTISNDRLSTSDAPVMKAYLSTNLFMPASTLVLKKSLKRVEKEIYPSEDTVDVDDIYGTFYLSDGDSGLYIKYGDTAPYPRYTSYKGSTAYDYSSLSIGNFEMIGPGSSLHLTQYISVGSEDIAEQHIENENRISLHPYPDAITPLILCGYDSGRNTMRYGKTDTFAIGNNSVEYTDVSGVMRLRNSLNSVLNDKERKIPYTISVVVSPPYDNILYCEGLRHPQMAYYHGEQTGTVILPESEPRTEFLSNRYTRQEFFSDWKNVIRSVSANNDMALFLMRSEDVENPIYSQNFQDIFSYAEEYGLTAVEPGEIADHFKNLQQVSFDSSVEMDEAVIRVTNENDVPVEGVTFVVRMPILDEGVYVADNGKIEKTNLYFDQDILWISVDLEAHQSKTISVRPSLTKKKLFIDIPDSLKEGMVKIIVRDDKGQPMKNARITIDDMPYTTSGYGNVSLYLRRGSYELTVEKAGYLKETLNIDVNSYFSVLEEMIKSVSLPQNTSKSV
ncbi:peptidase associated/transthyretin-like domain-containing protein [Methanogenium cariaci]